MKNSFKFFTKKNKLKTFFLYKSINKYKKYKIKSFLFISIYNIFGILLFTNNSAV